MNATAGVQITASHNPKTDNGFKFYWSYGGYDSKHPGRRYGGQVVPPMDAEFMQLVRGVKEISPPPPPEVRAKFVRPVPREVDTAYWESVGGLSLVSNRSARVVFGAIHGAGKMNVLPVLQNAGFEVFAMQEQIEPNENFPQAAGKLINPEFREVVKPALEYARAVEADIAVCSDPDADRAGILARTELQRADSLELLRGDDVGAALTHFVLDQRRALGKTGPDDLVLETLVTTSLIGDIARSYGVQCIDDLLVGFKWVAQVLQQREDAGRVGFFFAAEESIGYLAGNFVRDKDASIAALLVSELASWLKDRNQTIWDLLDELYVRHGFYKNLQYLIELPGKAGMEVMQEVMLGLRALAGANKISKIAERDVAGWSDLLAPESTRRGAYALGKADDILTFWLSPDKKSRVTLRPSGTEPKLKYYVQLYEPAVDDLARVKARYEAEARAVALDLVEWSARSIGEGLDPARREILREQWGRGEPRFV
jgi:phosphoglucomutase/phosphomannomutase